MITIHTALCAYAVVILSRKKYNTVTCILGCLGILIEFYVILTGIKYQFYLYKKMSLVQSTDDDLEVTNLDVLHLLDVPIRGAKSKAY